MIKHIPEALLCAIQELSQTTKTRVYLSGGVLRDWQLGISAIDFDFTVSKDGLDFGKRLASALQATFVRLAEEEGICRVVWKGLVVDISTFRKNTQCIEDDLLHRDFTINAMAVDLSLDVCRTADFGKIIDPLGGMDDLQNRTIRACNATCLGDDPLRLLRAFRLMAQFGFSVESQTAQL